MTKPLDIYEAAHWDKCQNRASCKRCEPMLDLDGQDIKPEDLEMGWVPLMKKDKNGIYWAEINFPDADAPDLFSDDPLMHRTWGRWRLYKN